MGKTRGEILMKVFPVVHINNNGVYEAIRESNRALELDADGIYLTDHCNGVKNTKSLIETYSNLLDESPDSYIGINMLGSGPYDAMRMLARSINKSKDLLLPPSGLWVDDMRYDGARKSAAIELRNSEPRLKHVRLLGGVAYKNTHSYTEDPNRAQYEVEWLKDSVDVIVTSGESNGRIPIAEKLIAMKEAVGDKPLAVTSAMSLENIRKYEGIVDEVLVHSGIETYHGIDIFDRRKLEDLIQLAHSFAK